MTGAWSAPVVQDGYNKLTFTIVNTGTQPYRFDTLRVEYFRERGSRQDGRVIVIVARDQFQSASVLTDGITSQRPWWSSAFATDIIYVELAPGEATQFVVLASRADTTRLRPIWDSDFSQVQAPPSLFPTTVVN